MDSFTDSSGTVRFEGTIAGDFILDYATEKAIYFTNNVAVTVAGGTYPLLPFVKKSGAALLDPTDPQRPEFVAAGVYAVTFWVFDYGNASQADCQLLIDLAMGTSAPIEAINMAPMGQTNPQGSQCAVSLTGYMSAGETLNGSVNHNDPVAHDVYHLTTIQRLST